MSLESEKSESQSTQNILDAFMNAAWNPLNHVADMEITNLAIEIKRREQIDDQRTRIGPVMEPPWSFWHGLAKAYLWMKHNGIKHWSERGRE